jgi:molecular chaperone GrpE (heat shock protein)
MIKKIHEKAACWGRALRRFLYERAIVPSIRLAILALSKGLENAPEPDPIETLEDWKKNALEDFGKWIQSLPDDAPALENPETESCDLYTLLSEFTALRQEIRLQNREQNKNIRVLDDVAASHRKQEEIFQAVFQANQRTTAAFERIADDLRTFQRDLRQEAEEQARSEAEKKTVLPFLDIRDSLIRGHHSAQAVSASRRFFGPPRGIEGVIEGYEMAIRRFDRALNAAGILPVEAVGSPFDPRLMRAVETRAVPGMDKGIVVESHVTGFVRGEEVIRTAEVVVSE